MKQLSIIRLLDQETFFLGAGSKDNIKKHQFLEVLNSRHSYKNLAQVVEVYDQYAMCKKLGKKKVFFGDTVRLRPFRDK
ncbi:hypothetical protein [Staphylococcus edaphicus]|uniref:Uncharacterized protein n=1 Tax=Staphylococcus edaphicus TaxID=1955013 RepID=A0A2C6WQR4_9STAP|nr:hypothetical protein [Staphylococcus edaphicus]PHK50473.1 hypothetical protein BTJ66_03200 [Staphylococcus edaphicus]UQW81157.1 hypothetical protein MNY58_11320 [Staphylococcus edaphicus]